jgi:rhodanese-related sulfurtransferase
MTIVSPAEAHARRQAGAAALVDVRSSGEFANGRPAGSVNVPLMDVGSAGMTPNPKFLETMEGMFGKDDALLISCQSGKRSAMAVGALEGAGFTNLTDVAGGFGSWGELPIDH